MPEETPAAPDAESAPAAPATAEDYATYCPEDNKLRIYIGWVERSIYERLRSEGWSATPKQSCDFVAVWTPDRRDTAIELASVILDEDMGPAERAADRAERFSGYLERRLDEADGHADRFDSGPTVHGFQSYAKAVRSADRHDRIAGRAVDAWEKAEYWTRRTEGVIRNALYKDEPGVRMGRINRLEAELRKREKGLSKYRKTYDRWVKVSGMEPGEKKDKLTRFLSDYTHRDFPHPRIEGVNQSLYSLLNRSVDPITTDEAISLWLTSSAAPHDESDWTRHLKLRLAYEHQMLGQQGSVAAMIEMVPGGWLRGGRHLRNEERRILKVNKSPVTGRVVSVLVRDNRASSVNRWGNPFPDGVAKVLCHQVEVERVSPDNYRAPTDAELAEFLAEQKQAKDARPKVEKPPLVNPTLEDATRLQETLNAASKTDHCERFFQAYGNTYESEFKPSSVCLMTQAEYSQASKGSFSRFETRGLCKGGVIEPRKSNMWMPSDEAEKKQRGPTVCEVRVGPCSGSTYGAVSVVVLTDKPQKQFPASLWGTGAQLPEPSISVEPVVATLTIEPISIGPVKQAELAL